MQLELKDLAIYPMCDKIAPVKGLGAPLTLAFDN